MPEGPGGEAARVWRLRPEMGAMVETMVRTVYGSSILPAAEREAARMKIAQLNACNACSTFPRALHERGGRRGRALLPPRRLRVLRGLHRTSAVGDRVRRPLRHRPFLHRRRPVRPLAHGVHRCRDPRSHHVRRGVPGTRSPRWPCSGSRSTSNSTSEHQASTGRRDQEPRTSGSTARLRRSPDLTRPGRPVPGTRSSRVLPRRSLPRAVGATPVTFVRNERG